MKPRTERYLTFRAFKISCNKLHATIHLKHNKKDRTYVIKCGRLSKRF
ncbi:hypothetical protein HMPREF9065_01961 [Aggregatibacter sp. oral taxon 458 str. W10330]|nr:hypothetical protein HMPREF9065_01961 [Aggregatibacter sp. oral taxon 458 str. W10330]